MHPEKVFESELLENPTVCNYCFRKRAHTDAESIPSNLPGVVPIYYPSETSEIGYPPETVEFVYKKREKRQNLDRFHIEDSRRIEFSHPSIICKCGRIDDERIDGEFPDDWEDRPKEKLENVGLRVYHRVEEEGFEIDYDQFFASLAEYKTSDEYEIGDYEILEKAVADSVSVKPENA